MLGLYCGDRFVAEELAQEALVRVWTHWGKVQSLDTPSGWAWRVAINLANSHLRRLRAERQATKRAAVPDSSRRLEHPDAQAIRDAVSRLPHRQRSAIVLRYYLDMPFVEVARIMDVPLGTAKSLARRAVIRLREQGWAEEALDVT